MNFKRPKRRDILKFHWPKDGNSHPLAIIKPESRRCLTNLANYNAPKTSLRYPKSRSAAVLVALFIGRSGDLYVLLSRRTSTLRTYAGDTSLPGGKWERGDRNLEYTARREAFEEIGLPIDRRKVPFLCTLEPFLAGNQLIVTPVVVLVLDKTIRPILNVAEVDSLFSHPLIAFLRSEPPFPFEPDTLEHKYHTYVDQKWQGFTIKVRFHRFLTGRETGGTKPIFGLTAAILIRAATVGYALAPDYPLEVPGQPSQAERIEHALKHHPIFRAALVKEGLISPEKLDAYKVVGGRASAAASPSRSPPFESSKPRIPTEHNDHRSAVAQSNQPPVGSRTRSSSPGASSAQEDDKAPGSDADGDSESSAGGNGIAELNRSKSRRGKLRSRL